MRAEILEREGSGLDQPDRVGRDHHLAPVATRTDPGCPMHVDSHVMPVDEQRFSGVDPNADSIRAVGQGGLHRCRTCDGVPCRREHAEERVPLRVDLNASELDERDTNDFPVPPQGLAVRFGTELAEELCRPFDVRKEECDGPARKVVGHVAERTTCAPAARRAGMPR